MPSYNVKVPFILHSQQLFEFLIRSHYSTFTVMIRFHHRFPRTNSESGEKTPLLHQVDLKREKPTKQNINLRQPVYLRITLNPSDL